MKNIKVMLWYDVEDFITPEADDALLALIDMMDSLGIRGSFKIVGEKIRVLKERGRTDILRKFSGTKSAITRTGTAFIPPRPSIFTRKASGKERLNLNAGNVGDLLKYRRSAGSFPQATVSRGQAGFPRCFPF